MKTAAQWRDFSLALQTFASERGHDFAEEIEAANQMASYCQKKEDQQPVGGVHEQR